MVRTYSLGRRDGTKETLWADFDGLGVRAAEVSFATQRRLSCVGRTVKSWKTWYRHVRNSAKVSKNVECVGCLAEQSNGITLSWYP